jgi:hypothetical protein
MFHIAISSVDCNTFYCYAYSDTPVPETARSRAYVCGRSLAGITDSNPAGEHESFFVVNVVCCQVEISATS